jgi:hypothetical protein
MKADSNGVSDERENTNASAELFQNHSLFAVAL